MRKTQLTLAIAGALALSATASAGTIDFQGVKTPTTDAEKRSILGTKSARIDGKKYRLDYNTIMRSGDEPAGSAFPFGTLVDENGADIGRVSNDNDFSSLIVGGDGGLYMVSHFESRPAAMYLTELLQDSETGQLSPVKTRPLDFSHVNGGWVHCAGSVTPWGNHLGSEEYPPDAKQWRDLDISSYNAEMATYFGVTPEINDDGEITNDAAIAAAVNPYDYGYTTEVVVNDYSDAIVTKHYAMGRVAIELSYVMPDEKTVYTSDDGSRVGLFMFVADTPRDLSAGTLYAARFDQASPWYPDEDTRVAESLRDGGAGDIEWIELGSASSADIRDIIDGSLTGGAPITFSNIFQEDVPDCTVIQNRDASKECLKVIPGMEKAAAFLETSRYAGIMGATTEWEKMEGITLDPDTNTMYLAMSRVRNAMTDGGAYQATGDTWDGISDIANFNPANHMSVPYNYCGTVYGLALDKDYMATSITGVVSGIPRLVSRGALVDKPYSGPFADNQCDVNGISEPDNVTFIPGYGTLIIGEDTGRHQNDMIWSYDVASAELTRIQTTPYGSETTSPYFYPNINGFGYMMSVVQHPFGESDQDALEVPEESRGYTGYVGPFPAMD
jgi:secreted PhoX family phosphatase